MPVMHVGMQKTQFLFQVYRRATIKIRILLRVNNYNLGCISNFKLVKDFLRNGHFRMSCILLSVVTVVTR